MDTIKEKLKIFERMHQELKQDKDYNACRNTMQSQFSQGASSEYSYWQDNVLSKPLQDLDMWFDFGSD